MKIATNLGEKLSALRVKPQPQPRGLRSWVVPLTTEELAKRHADATERAEAREREHRRLHPVTFTIAHRR
jgi:hypothetical protein